MKIVIEKVPEGVKVSITHDTAKKPATFVIQPGQLGLITTMLQTAMNSTAFKFEFQT